VPSYNQDGSFAGKSTIGHKGMYFDNDNSKKDHRDKRDTITGEIRPWALGPRVPMFIISPWSKGGWVHSEVADHTSVGQFIEKRFDIEIPAISPWHRAVCSDLTSAFEFESPNDYKFPKLPKTSDYLLKERASRKLPKAVPPKTPSPLYQEEGVKYSRALPYRLMCHFEKFNKEKKIGLRFENKGTAGAVYHVYDLFNLESIPKRYTVEAGKSIEDRWAPSDNGKYSLEVFGPNGFFRKYVGQIENNEPAVRLQYDHEKGGVAIKLENPGKSTLHLDIISNAYDYEKGKQVSLSPGKSIQKSWKLAKSGNWYDFSVKSGNGFHSRFAGRVETGEDGISDPAMATTI
jgi:phospholipase C